MKTIKLSRGLEAMVDDADYDKLSEKKWFALPSRGTFYASRGGKHTYPNGRYEKAVYTEPSTIGMHREILGITDPLLQADHIDGNGLNNQRSNLRIVSIKQNQHNQKKHSDKCSSKFKGVHKEKNKTKWRATFGSPKRIHLGDFDTETEAALAYNFMAIHHFGEFARLNDVQIR